MRKIPLDTGKNRAWRSQRWRVFDTAINWEHIETVLNIGARKRDFFLRNILDKHRCITTVLEVFQPYVHVLEIDPALEVHQGNLLDYKFAEDRQWDMVLWWNGAEHLRERAELDVALANLEPLARKLMVCGTPWGKYPQSAIDGNPLQEHRCVWTDHDWEERNYHCVLLAPPIIPQRNQLMAFKATPGGGYTGPKGKWWKKK